MTRAAASNRKHSTGSGAAANARPGPVFRGRDVVFVDPLDAKESYWWPAMIVPVPEIDSTMDCRILNPGECLVKYFEDNKYSVVPFSDLQPFVPTTVPFLEFEEAAGQKFLRNGGVLNALAYLESSKVKRKFSWNRWGSAQDQDLSMDLNKHKAITLPLISDEVYTQNQAQAGSSSSGGGGWSPASSSFTDHETENSGDPTTATNAASTAADANQPPQSGTDPKKHLDSTTPETTSDSSSATSGRQSKGDHLRNGLQRPLVNSTTNHHGALPSPVSLEDLTTASGTTGDQSGTEFSVRSTKGTSGTQKDSPRARSRRGSRDDAAPGQNNNNNNTRSRNTSENSSSSSPSGLTINTATPSGTTPSNNGSPVSLKRALSESMKKTGPGSGSVSGRSSRQGSVEPVSSPRSTRHSSRAFKTTEDIPSKAVEEETTEMAIDEKSTSPLRIKTHRMSRTRSAPKPGASSLSPHASQPSQSSTVQNGKIWGTAGSASSNETLGSIKGESTTKMTVDTPEGKDLVMATSAVASKLNGTSNLQTADLTVEHSSMVSSSSSSTPSPASIEPEETNDATAILQYLDQDRQTVIYNFDHILPTLPIGSKEREVIYETCMEHLQKLRKEHRRLKEVLKGSEFALKGRRATRSSPLFAALQHSRTNQNDRVNSPGAPNKNVKDNKNSNVINNNNHNNSNSSSNSSNTHEGSSGTNGTVSDSGTTKAEQKSSGTLTSPSLTAAAAATEPVAPSSPSLQAAALPPTPPSPPPPPIFTGSTPSSAILTSNISATTRRSAAAAAAIAVTAVINRGRSASSKPAESKKRAASAMATASATLSTNASAVTAAAAAAAAATAGDVASREVLTRAKRRMR